MFFYAFSLLNRCCPYTAGVGGNNIERRVEHSAFSHPRSMCWLAINNGDNDEFISYPRESGLFVKKRDAPGTGQEQTAWREQEGAMKTGVGKIGCVGEFGAWGCLRCLYSASQVPGMISECEWLGERQRA